MNHGTSVGALVAESLAALQAENARLKADRDSWEQQADQRATELLEALRENEALKAQIARMKRVDAEIGGAWEEVNVLDGRIDDLKARVEELEYMLSPTK